MKTHIGDDVTCPLCHEIYESEEDTNQHLSEAHGGNHISKYYRDKQPNRKKGKKQTIKSEPSLLKRPFSGEIEVVEIDCSPEKTITKCPICDMTFKDMVSFKQHQMKEEHFPIKHTQLVTTIKCPLCDLGFASNDELQHHFTDTANTSKAIKCGQCCAIFQTISQKDSHVQTKHAAINVQESAIQPLKKGQKLVTLGQVKSFVDASPVPITIVEVESDVQGRVNTIIGPWIYKNMKNVSIHYNVVQDGVEKRNKILLQHLFKRGFGKSTTKEDAPTTPNKHKSTNSPLVSPMKKLNLQGDSSEAKAGCTLSQVTPTKRKSITSSEIEPPLKKLDIDDDDESTTPKFEFIPPLPPTDATPTSRYGLKTLTLDLLNTKIAQSKCNIIIEKVETDSENSPNILNGPWFYKNKRKVLIYYRVLKGGAEESEKNLT